MDFLRNLCFKITVGGIIALATANLAQAALIKQLFTGNDCAGDPGCVATEAGPSTTGTGSPWIIKFNNDGTIDELNTTAFPTVDGSEFQFVPALTGTLGSGTWTYTPGTGDPQIRFWVAKGGPNYNFFYDNGPDNAGGAEAVTSGSWETPINPANDQNFGLSHLSFYDTTASVTVPAPAALALFGLGLFGTKLLRRRRDATLTHGSTV